MQSNKFNELQINMLQSFVPEDMSAKAFIRFGRNMLGTYRKTKAYLRDEPANEHWLTVKALVLGHIDTISSAIPGYLLELTPEDDHTMLSFYELITCCSQVAHEEFKLDEAVSVHDLDNKPMLSEAQLNALLKLEADD